MFISSITASAIDTSAAYSDFHDNPYLRCRPATSTPELREIKTGANTDDVHTNYMIITKIVNYCDFTLKFVVFIEVRDTGGNTMFLQWHTGELNSSSQSELGMWWRLAQPGTYELRTFAISNFTSPEILTQVKIGEGVAF